MEQIPEGPRHLEAVASRFAGRSVGHTIIWRAATGSTMDDAWAAAAAGAAAGTVVGADAQTAGRGRHSRVWLSTPGEDLLFSVVLRPAPAAASELSMLAGLAVSNAVDRIAGAATTVKWPNDVRVDGLKIAGVLVETSVEGETITSVAGFGVNVNLEPAAHPEIAATSTSLARVTGRSCSRTEVLVVVLEELNALYDSLVADGSVRDEWAARVETVGKRVELVAGSDLVRGEAVGIAYDGSLLVRDDNGRTRSYAAGEVTLQALRQRLQEGRGG